MEINDGACTVEAAADTDDTIVNPSVEDKICHRSQTEDAASPRQRRRRQWLFVFSCLNTFFFVGSFFGWGPFQLLLENNSAFDWKCGEDESENNVTSTVNSTTATADTTTIYSSTTAAPPSSSSDAETCAEQKAALLNINLIATTTQISSPLLGHFLDKRGPKAGVYFMTASLWTGLALLTLASSRHEESNSSSNVARDRLLYVSIALLAMVTWMGGLMTVQVGLYFTGHTRSRVIFLLNALFDAGSVVYLLVWMMAEAAESVSLTIWMGGFLGLGVLIMTGSLYFWTVTVKAPEIEEEDDFSRHMKDAQEKLSVTATTSMALSGHPMSDQNELLKESPDELMPSKDPAMVSVVNDGIGEPIIDEMDDDNVDGPAILNDHDALPETEYRLVAKRTPKQQLISPPFLLLSFFFAVQCVSNQWNLSTMREFLAYLGDDAYDNRYLTIFTLLLPAGIVCLPLVDAILLRLGFAGAFQCINLLALGYTLVKVSSDSLNVQIVGFCLFALFRCLFFGIVFAYLPVLLSGDVVGKAAGIMFALTGLATFVCVPLAQWAVQGLGGNFLIPNIIFCVLVVPCVLVAHGLGVCMKREDAARAERQEMHQRWKDDREKQAELVESPP